MTKLRLVKVFVQPVFVLDHGDRIEEVEHPAITIPADEWPSYSGERFPAEVKVWQERLDAERAEQQADEQRNRERRRPKR